MGHFSETINDLMKSGKGTQAQAIQVVEMLDDEFMEPLRRTNIKEYWRIMRKMHEINNGCHYNEAFAIYEVEQMQHTDESGKIHKGAHWTMDAVKQVYAANKSKFKGNPNICDLYVGIHSWWHDNIDEDIKDFGEDAEAKNVARAINYFFCDEDAPEGKIWLYYKGMRCKCE